MPFWISVTSKDHALAGLAGGFIQAHGDKADQLHQLRDGDIIFFYSPGTLFRAGTILQAFTAAARVSDAAPYAVEPPAKAGRASKAPAASAHPRWRRSITPLTADEAPAAALVPDLEFITDKENWATAMGRNLFAIGDADGRRIAAAMHATLD